MGIATKAKASNVLLDPDDVLSGLYPRRTLIGATNKSADLALLTTQSPTTIPRGSCPRPPLGPSVIKMFSAIPEYGVVLLPLMLARIFLATSGACPVIAL